MVWKLLVMILFLLLIAPVRVTLHGHAGDTLHCTLVLRVWGIRKTLRIGWMNGRIVLLPHRSGDAPRMAGMQDLRRDLTLLRTVLRSNVARRWLARHLHLRGLDVRFRISGSNAAHTALMTGALWNVLPRLPASWRRVMHLQIQPDFAAIRTVVSFRCIVFFHLGMLLPAALLLLTAWLTERAPMNAGRCKPHGTSHR